MAQKKPETKSRKKAKGSNQKSKVEKTEYQLDREAQKNAPRRKKRKK